MKSFNEYITEALKTKEIKASEFPDPLSKRLKAIFQTKGDMDGEEQDDVVQTRDSSWAASNLKPSQSAIFLGKALGMAIGGVKGGDLGSIVSKDKHILDGHHRWAATLFSEPSAKIHGIEANLGIGDLVPVLRALGDSIGNQRRGEPAGGDVNIFKAKFQDVLDAIHDGKNMHSGFYNKDKAEAWLESIGGEDELKNRFAFIQKQTPPKGAPPRIEMPVIDADKGDEKLASKLLSKGKLDVRAPYANTTEENDLSEWSDSLFKGWVNVKTRKIVAHTNSNMRPWHVQMIVLDPKTFGVSEKQIKSYLRLKVEDWGYYDDAESIEGAVSDSYNNLIEGDKDMDTTVEMMAMKKGWCRFVQSGQWVDIKGSGKLDNLRQACIILDQKHGIFSEGKPVHNLELVLRAPSGKMDVKTRGSWGINDTDIKRWLRYGGDPNKLPKEKELERQDVTKARMSGRHSPGHDEWGPVKDRGSKKWRKIYAHKEHPFKSFREFIN